MPGDGFPFAVRVGCQEDVVGLFDGLGYGIDMLGITLDQLILHAVLVFGIHRTLLGNQITHVAIGGEDFEIRTKVFFQSFRLGGRLYDQKAGRHARLKRVTEGSG